MSIPNSIDKATPLGTDTPGAGDDQIRALKLFIEDVFGIPDATSITNEPMNIGSDGSIVINDDSADIDFRVEGANNANMIVLDGGQDALSFGGTNVDGAAFTFNNLQKRTFINKVGSQFHVPIQTTVFDNASETIAVGAGAFFGIPTWDGDNATLTITAASTVYIEGPPVDNTNVTATDKYAFHVAAGASRFDGIIQGPDADDNLDLASADILLASATSMVFRIDSDNDESGKNYHWQHNAGTQLMQLTDAGLLMLGDTANANMTIGLTINQSTNDDQAFCLKSSTDIVTGLSTITIGQDVETDDFFTISKGSGTTGGVVLQALGETGQASPFILETWGGGPSTTDTTSSGGAIAFRAGEHNGSNADADMAANSNLFTIAEIDSSNVALTRLLLKADDGELHLGNTTIADLAADDEDDVALLRAFSIHRSDPKTIIKTKWDEFVTYNYDDLVRVGLLGKDGPDGSKGLWNFSGHVKFLNGAVWQLYTRHMELQDRYSELENRLLALEGPHA